MIPVPRPCRHTLGTVLVLLSALGCMNVDAGDSTPHPDAEARGDATTHPDAEARGDATTHPDAEAGGLGPCPTNAIECPDSGPAPTYANDVLPILEAHCTVCHGPGGEKQDVLLTPYSQFVRRTGTSLRAQTAISKVQNCQMPPPPQARVSEAERETLVCWYARGRLE